MVEYYIDYQSGLTEINSASFQDPFQEMVDAFEDRWLRHYKEMTPRPTEICGQYVHGFEYVYDFYTHLEKAGVAPYNDLAESRLVYVHGRSQAPALRRNASRQKGWVGPTEKSLGANTDKGHFMAHSLGGLEINVFAQDRATNRGWSHKGKTYRKMEKYCVANPDTYCFSRPIYHDLSSRPVAFDFGVLLSSDELWVETFENY